MEARLKQSQRVAPEQLVYGLVKRLSFHALWDTLLVTLPPLMAVLYCLFYLILKAWISPMTAAAVGFAAMALSALAITTCYRPNIPSIRLAARLIDDRAGAEDRFLTLATLQPSPPAAFLVSRLRAEASKLQTGITIKREFPYRIRWPAYSSLLLSLAAVVLFQLFLPLAYSTLHPKLAHQRLRDLAQLMAERPKLQETARALYKLAAKLEDPNVPPQAKQSSLREEREKIQEQEKKETQRQDHDLLSQAAGELQGLEQQSGRGERKQDQDNGAGGIQSNLPQQGQGEGKQSQSGDNKGDSNAQLSNEMQLGTMAQGGPKNQSNEKNAGDKNAGTGNKPDPNNPGKDQSKDRGGKIEDGRNEQTGRSKASEDIPHGTPPAERYYKPGEGQYQGIKGAGYVTVQLPEELAAEGKGAGQEKDSKGGKALSSQVPVSNVPLPKHVPDAPAEKQQMPLEYRGIIR
jgi:hypothetical protein